MVGFCPGGFYSRGFFPKGVSGVCPGFLKGGSNISWFPKKRSSDFKRGVQWSDGGGPVH